ncbi:MAG TPA: hypothetical protein VFF07_09865 [Actinomycetota bacterium]|nr:hypothetical protein [Actinomycetota bacterium]
MTQEHLMDDTFEGKIFAPGYGEFQVRAEDEFAAIAVASPIDAVPGAAPAELEALTVSSADAFQAGQVEDGPGRSARGTS